MPETAEPEIGNISHIFDKVMPMSAEDMEGGIEPPPEEQPPARTRDTAAAQQQAEKQSAPPPKTPPATAQEEPLIPEILFGENKTPLATVTEEEKEPVKETVPAEIKDKKARENFERLATAKYERDKENFELRKKLKAAEERAAAGDPNAKTRIEALEKQISQQSELVARANLEMHPEFQARYTVPRQQLLESAKSALKDSDVDPQLLDQALGLRGKARADKLNEIYGEVQNKFLLSKVERAIDGIETLDANKDAVMQNASVYAKQLQEAEAVARAKQTQAYEEQTRANLKESHAFLKDKFGLEVLQTVDDPKYQWWNDQAKKIESTAEDIMLRISDPKQLTVAAHLAAAAIPYRTLFRQEREQRIKLQQQLKDLRGSEPNLSGGVDETSGTETEEDENVPLAASIIKSIKKFERQGM